MKIHRGLYFKILPFGGIQKQTIVDQNSGVLDVPWRGDANVPSRSKDPQTQVPPPKRRLAQTACWKRITKCPQGPSQQPKDRMGAFYTTRAKGAK
jgi:hypothetical protein